MLGWGTGCPDSLGLHLAGGWVSSWCTFLFCYFFIDSGEIQSLPKGCGNNNKMSVKVETNTWHFGGIKKRTDRDSSIVEYVSSGWWKPSLQSNLSKNGWWHYVFRIIWHPNDTWHLMLRLIYDCQISWWSSHLNFPRRIFSYAFYYLLVWATELYLAATGTIAGSYSFGILFNFRKYWSTNSNV